MPGVRKLDALPKPMQALVEAMKLQNILTGDELVTKEHLDRAPAELRKKCYSNLSYQLKAHFPDKATAYTLLATPEENAEWLAAFINDPKTGGSVNTVAHEVRREKQQINDTIKVWLTEEQLGGPQFMNSLKHAQLMVQHGSMDSRKSQYVALAEQGVKEFAHHVNVETCRKLLADGVITKSQCEMDPEDLIAMNEAMVNFDSTGPGASASSGAAPAAANSVSKKPRLTKAAAAKVVVKDAATLQAEAEALVLKKAAESDFNKARSECTSLSQKMKKDLLAVDVICNRFARKGYGNDTVSRLNEMKEAQLTAAASVFTMWEKYSLVKSSQMSIIDMATGVAEMRTYIEEVKTNFNEFKSEELSQFTKAQ